MYDTVIRPQKHNRTDGKRGVTKQPKDRLFSNIEVRYVYENELKGEWFLVASALFLDVPIIPNQEHKVIRIEFRDVSDLGIPEK